MLSRAMGKNEVDNGFNLETDEATWTFVMIIIPQGSFACELKQIPKYRIQLEARFCVLECYYQKLHGKGP